MFKRLVLLVVTDDTHMEAVMIQEADATMVSGHAALLICPWSCSSCKDFSWWRAGAVVPCLDEADS